MTATRPAAPPLLEVTDVGKRYGAQRALERLTFALRPGEVVGLLGPNGAGKTTALSILSSVLVPDSGHVAIEGQRLDGNRHRRRRIGLVPQALAIYPTLTAEQNVVYFGRMLGLARAGARAAARAALEAVGLGARAHDPARALSGGMQRRLNLACGIVHRPDVLLLDEPTVGVDIESRERILALVARLGADGVAVVYSTHYMEEVERLCDRVLLLDRGVLVADDTVAALIARAQSRPRIELTCREHPSDGVVASIAGVVAASQRDGRVVLELEQLAQVPAVLDGLRSAGVAVVDFSLHSPNLADAFSALTGRALRDPGAG